VKIDQEFPGLYRGTVYSNKDPLGKGRLRLKVPQILANEVTAWAWPLDTPGVTTPAPEVGQGVWVMFEGGDTTFPIWVGSFGKETSSDYNLKVDRLVPGSYSETIDELMEIASEDNVTSEWNLTQTILKIATKLMERNYGSFYDTTIQSATAANSPTPIALGTVDFASNMSVVDGSKITLANVGTYNLQWSGQFVNTASSDHDARVWLRYNGVDYPQSASIVCVPSKHGSVDGHLVAAWNWLGKSQNPGDYVQIMWSSDSTTVSLKSYPADAAGPAVPSVIVTVTECE
jgi:hypothetical protein